MRFYIVLLWILQGNFIVIYCILLPNRNKNKILNALISRTFLIIRKNKERIVRKNTVFSSKHHLEIKKLPFQFMSGPLWLYFSFKAGYFSSSIRLLNILYNCVINPNKTGILEGSFFCKGGPFLHISRTTNPMLI